MILKRFTLALAFCCSQLGAAPTSGIDLSNFDPSVRFQDDLYTAVNGSWLQTTEIPPDQASYGTFNQLRDLSESRSRTLIENTLNRQHLSGEELKIRDLYFSSMRVSAIDALGFEPIIPELQRITKVNSLTALTRTLGELQRSPLNLPLRVSVQPDAMHASTTLLQLSQGGLGLPERDYYLKNDTRFSEVRRAYQRYLVSLFTLSGFSDAPRRARSVLALETMIARAQWSAVENRDPQKTYNNLTQSQLQQQAPALAWQQFLSAADIAAVERINLEQPSYARDLALLLRDVPRSIWRDYLRARTLDAYAPFLSQPFVSANFAFHQQALSGVRQPPPRWKRAVRLVEAGLGQALGKLYVAEYFPARSKQRIDLLVSNLMQAYGQSITTLEWMTPATRQQALRKLAQYRVKIAYPSVWRDYTGLQIQPTDLVGNVQRITAFKYRYALNKLGRPVDREEWLMTPQTVNAYYEQQLNEIVFPAAILQPPFFDAQADDAVNYGAIGAVIGHEISHGFDDQGSQYDGEGNLRDWWSRADKANFKARTDRLVAQYGAYQPLPGYRVNGQLTLGENIADNAGLQIAYKAYHLSLNGKKAPVIDGLSGDQRFFIGFAQVWRSKMQNAQLLKQLVSDPHTPAHWRVRGAVVNSNDFYQAFDIKPSDQMYRPESSRVQLW